MSAIAAPMFGLDGILGGGPQSVDTAMRDAARASLDRRTSARSPLFMMVRGRDTRDPLWAWDISLGGLLCRSKKPRWPGTYLDLCFRLPNTNEVLEVGSQVLSIDDAPEGALSMGLRFCRISAKTELSIYRFLDRRRGLWGGEANAPAPSVVSPPVSDVPAAGPSPAVHHSSATRSWVQQILAQPKPFEPLLLEAYAAMRAKELTPTGSVRALRAA